ncbi:MAG: acyltransferase family protein [Rikenellaceae bacterium]
MTDKKRIEFIDLAKGICIIFVVASHCGFAVDLPGLGIVRMPLYFILSGLFFKEYSGFGEFVVRKTNKILIPFIFFYLVSYALYYMLQYLAPQLLITDARGVFDIFNNRQYFNGPIWFLLSLYWCGLIFAGVIASTKSLFVRCVAVLAIGCGGVFLGGKDLFLPMFIDVAMTALPFYCFGYYLKRTAILYQNKYDRYNLIFVAILYIASLVISRYAQGIRLSLHYNGINNPLATFTLSITSTMTILLLCKTIKHIPIISYMGRYSLIILCTHHLIYRPLKVVSNMMPYGFMHESWFLTLVTISVSVAFIPLCIRFIPYFVAQKDLIKCSKD